MFDSKLKEKVSELEYRIDCRMREMDNLQSDFNSIFNARISLTKRIEALESQLFKRCNKCEGSGIVGLKP